MKKQWVLVGVILVMITGAGSYWNWYSGNKKIVLSSHSLPVVVQVTKVKWKSLPIQIQVIGRLLARQQVTLRAQVAGTIQKIGFEEGQEVKQGAPLVWLDPRIYAAQLKAAQAKLNIDALTYQRDKKVANYTSKQTLDQVKANYESQKAHTDLANTELSQTTTVAPFSGRLGVRHINLGQYVKVGDELVTLVEDTHLRVDYWVPDQYLPMLKIGQTVNVKVVGQKQQFKGKVVFIAPMVDSHTGTIEVHAVITNSHHQLFPGQYVKVTQLLGITHGLVIPARSLVSTISGEQVYIVRQNKVYAQPVKVSERVSNFVKVNQGLKWGDIVVTDGQEKLRDGVLVKIQSH